jgi:hypothetical protein
MRVLARAPDVALGLATATAAGLRLVAGGQPALVEAGYSRGVYPHVARGLGGLADAVHVTLAETLLPVAVLAALGTIVLSGLRRPGRGARATLAVCGGRLLGAAGAAYLAFLALWGLNYERRPLAEQAGLDARSPTTIELEGLGRSLLDEADRLRTDLPEDETGVLRLEDGVQGALRRVSAGFDAATRSYTRVTVPACRPKPAFFSPLLSRLGLAGIYVPFTGEPLVNADMPAPALPWSAAHELAHAKGFAREGEASFLGFVACRLHPDADIRYSALLEGGIHVAAALRASRPEAARRLFQNRSPATARDLDALREWSAKYEGRVAEASRRVNDAYLRSQGQGQGIRSYGRFVDLLVAEARRSEPAEELGHDR